MHQHIKTNIPHASLLDHFETPSRALDHVKENHTEKLLDRASSKYETFECTPVPAIQMLFHRLNSFRFPLKHNTFLKTPRRQQNKRPVTKGIGNTPRQNLGRRFHNSGEPSCVGFQKDNVRHCSMIGDPPSPTRVPFSTLLPARIST